MRRARGPRTSTLHATDPLGEAVNPDVRVLRPPGAVGSNVGAPRLAGPVDAADRGDRHAGPVNPYVLGRRAPCTVHDNIPIVGHTGAVSGDAGLGRSGMAEHPASRLPRTGPFRQCRRRRLNVLDPPAAGQAGLQIGRLGWSSGQDWCGDHRCSGCETAYDPRFGFRLGLLGGLFPAERLAPGLRLVLVRIRRRAEDRIHQR